jgi:hydroxymethylpyrimidine pyrophosphatase-like HAD family hydrolase
MNIKAVIFDLEGTLFRANNLSQQHLGALIQLIAERRGVSILDAKSLLRARITIGTDLNLYTIINPNPRNLLQFAA